MGSVDCKPISWNDITYLNDDLIAWFTYKQAVVIILSAEAEYFAVTDACKDGLKTNYFVSEVIIPIAIHSQGGMYMATNLATNKRSKQTDLRSHLIRDFVSKGVVNWKHISTEHDIVGIMTKALQRPKHNYFTSMLVQDQEE